MSTGEQCENNSHCTAEDRNLGGQGPQDMAAAGTYRDVDRFVPR